VKHGSSTVSFLPLFPALSNFRLDPTWVRPGVHRVKLYHATSNSGQTANWALLTLHVDGAQNHLVSAAHSPPRPDCQREICEGNGHKREQ